MINKGTGHRGADSVSSSNHLYYKRDLCPSGGVRGMEVRYVIQLSLRGKRTYNEGHNENRLPRYSVSKVAIVVSQWPSR